MSEQQPCPPVPDLPDTANGDTRVLWSFMQHLDAKIDLNKNALDEKMDRNHWRQVQLTVGSLAITIGTVLGALFAMN